MDTHADTENGSVETEADAAPPPPAKAQHGIKEKITVEGEGPVGTSDGGFRFGRLLGAGKFHPVVLKMTTCETLGGQNGLSGRSQSPR